MKPSKRAVAGGFDWGCPQPGCKQHPEPLPLDWSHCPVCQTPLGWRHLSR